MPVVVQIQFKEPVVFLNQHQAALLVYRLSNLTDSIVCFTYLHDVPLEEQKCHNF